MKKNSILFLLLLFMVSFLLIGVNFVYAKNGPASEGAYIELYNNGEDYAVIYDDGKIDNDAIGGVSYNKSNNTLTLNSLKSTYELIIYNMGDDFKLNLIGENGLQDIYMDCDSWSSTLNITGNGSLVINKNRESETAIVIIAGKIIVEDTVTLKMYASLSDDYYEDYKPYVIGIISSDIEDGYKVMKFKNREDIEISSEQEYAFAGNEPINGFYLKESDNPRNYTIVIKDGKKYGMYESNAGYIVTGGEISYDEENKEYFIDNTDEKEDSLYSSMNEVTSNGYTIKDEKIYISKEIFTSTFFVQLDKDENEYALYVEYLPDGTEGDKYLYDITSYSLTLSNGRTYTLLIRNTDIDISKLTPKEIREYQDTFYHMIYGSSLEILPNKYECIKGNGQEYVYGSNNDLTFVFNFDYDEFNSRGKIYIDNKEVSRKNYTINKGSTIITFNKDFVSTLSNGTHNLVVQLDDYDVNATFTVTRIVNPKTVDNIFYYVIILIISLCGLIGSTLYVKKRNN